MTTTSGITSRWTNRCLHAALAATATLVAACSSASAGGTSDAGSFDAGGPCSYAMVPGTIKITKISPVTSATNCPNDGQEVVFTFTADGDAQVPPESSGSTLTLSNGDNPPASCLGPAGIVVGATFTATARVETSGTCSPLLVDPSMVGVDLAACEAECDGGTEAGSDAGAD